MLNQKIALVRNKLVIESDEKHWMPRNFDTDKKRPKENMGVTIRNKHVNVPQEMSWTYIMCFSVRKYPTEANQICSHLCHEKKCCNPNHLVWEDEVRNKQREICVRARECICKLEPKCIFL